METGRIRPLFIFSLPRSGSTLLQRVLGSHEAISTASEPWLLLPLLYTLRNQGAYAEYGHRASTQAIGDFIKELPNGADEYNGAIRDFALRLYNSAASHKPSARYFLDKTPRYHLLANEIVELFPEGRFIFLWRNPIAVAASIIETFGRGKWQLYDYKVDLFDGLSSLVECFERHADKVLSVRFEDLVTNPEKEGERILRYLSLPENSFSIDQFNSVRLKGTMGDPTGTVRYSRISTEPTSKWAGTLRNPLRKWWTARYLRWIGEKRLARMGYDTHLLQQELSRTPFSIENLVSDTFRVLYGISQCGLETRIISKKVKQLTQWHTVHGHT